MADRSFTDQAVQIVGAHFYSYQLEMLVGRDFWGSSGVYKRRRYFSIMGKLLS
jgi:hypothetical protein